MKLGELLIRDGRLSQEDLEGAIQLQQSDGGKLGSILVESSKIDAETLTVYLGLELGIPIATGGTLERCKKSAVKLLSPAQAAEFQCIPIVIQGQTLIVALNNPHDVMTLDAISRTTGYRVIPRVAPEIRILYYLERYYGVARPKRYAALADSLRGNREVDPAHSNLPNPPLPGLPREVPPPDGPKKPLQPIKTRSKEKSTPPPAPKTKVTKAQAAIQDDAVGLSAKLDDNTDATANQVEHRAEMGTAPAPKAPNDSVNDIEPMSVDDALLALDHIDRHGAIADLILRACLSLFESTVLCLVRDGMLLGWKGVGPGINPDRVESILIPLDAPSIFQEAIEKDLPYEGRAFPTTVNNHWFKILRTSIVDHSYVSVVRIGKRPVNVIYGHRKNGEACEQAQMADLWRVLDAASAAYIRLISQSKKKNTET